MEINYFLFFFLPSFTFGWSVYVKAISGVVFSPGKKQLLFFFWSRLKKGNSVQFLPKCGFVRSFRSRRTSRGFFFGHPWLSFFPCRSLLCDLKPTTSSSITFYTRIVCSKRWRCIEWKAVDHGLWKRNSILFWLHFNGAQIRRKLLHRRRRSIDHRKVGSDLGFEEAWQSQDWRRTSTTYREVGLKLRKEKLKLHISRNTTTYDWLRRRKLPLRKKKSTERDHQRRKFSSLSFSACFALAFSPNWSLSELKKSLICFELEIN